MYRQSVLTFGPAQADRYYDGLLAITSHLLQFPRSAPVWTGGKGDLRVATYESHRIVYRLAADELVIVRVLHQHQDMARHLK